MSTSHTTARELPTLVKQETNGNHFRAETGSFLKTFFDIPDAVVESAYEALVTNGVYDAMNEKWGQLPQVGLELDYYEPFCQAAKEISESALTVSGSPPDHVCTWLDTHRKSSFYIGGELAALQRPDICCMLGTEADCRSWGEPVAAKLREEERADTDKLVAWWHRVHIPVEIRPSTRSSADELDSTFSVEDNNLLGYMRQTFREQHDRQFMVGLLLCGTQLSIIHCDRSGVVSTKDPIDIHKNPKDFIRIIAGCVLSPPSQLGWDLSMKLWIPQLGQFMHSYSKYLLFSHFHQLEYRLSWVIIIADDRYVTIETLSARQSEVMVGRTSVIWAAVRLGDPPSERPKIYVIKQTWKPVSATPEWDFYDIGSDIKFVPSLESYDERTKTSQIRQGLSGIGPVLAKSGVRRYCLPSDGWNLQDSPARKLWIEKKPKIPKIVDRVQTRVVMKSYGWPLSCFKSLKELLSVIKDIVLAHRLLYHRGTLHRDMSSSNMLISPVPADSNSVHGLLIDFEFALSTNLIRVPESRKWTSSLKVHENTDRHKLIRKFPGFPKSAIDVWTLYGSHFPFEIDRLGELRGFQEESEISTRDILLYDDETLVPDFSGHQLNTKHDDPHTFSTPLVTFPFASPEIIDNFRMSSANVKPLVHDAIHDLEATFWLLNHLCITLPGPSFSRRNELKVPAGPEDKLLYQKVEELFGDSNFRALALKKRGMFARDSYTDEVVPLFHPYFKPLVPMLTEWWKMLMFSHNVPLIERVHDWVLDIIENALLDPAICHQENPEYAKQEAIMEEERLKQLSALCREGKETLILLSGLPQDAWTWPDDGHNPPDQVPQSPSTQDAGDSPLLVGPGKEDPDHSGTDKEGPNNGRQGKRPRSDSLLLRRLSGSPAPDFQVPGGDAPGPVQKKARHSAGEDKQETSTGIIRKGSS